jgi:hypothetical protein
MKKRRHWIEEGNYSVLYSTACRVIVETHKVKAEWFVLWLLMHEARVSIRVLVCIIINPKHMFAFVILKATGIDRI